MSVPILLLWKRNSTFFPQYLISIWICVGKTLQIFRWWTLVVHYLQCSVCLYYLTVSWLPPATFCHLDLQYIFFPYTISYNFIEWLTDCYNLNNEELCKRLKKKLTTGITNSQFNPSVSTSKVIPCFLLLPICYSRRLFLHVASVQIWNGFVPAGE